MFDTVDGNMMDRPLPTLDKTLLEKEEVLYKENESLDSKTKDLLQKIEEVMKIQDNLLQESLNTSKELDDNGLLLAEKDTASALQNKYDPNVVNEFLQDKENRDLQIPNTVKDMGSKGIIHFYMGKVKCLHDCYERLLVDFKVKAAEAKQFQKEKQTVAEEKEKLFVQCNTARNNLAKLQSRVSYLTSQVESKDNEIEFLRKEVKAANREVKLAQASLAAMEVRLTRSIEESEKSKLALKTAKEETKEMQQQFKKQIGELTNNIKVIEKHKNELLNGFKKQQQLLENLKRQKVHIEATRMVEITEKEFMRMLDWDVLN